MAPQCGEERELISLLWCLVQALGGRCICALGRGTELEAQVWGSEGDFLLVPEETWGEEMVDLSSGVGTCLLYTSDAADEDSPV